MLVAHGLGSGPAPHRHIRIGSHIEAVKIGHSAEIVDRALSVEIGKVYTAHLKALDGKVAPLYIVSYIHLGKGKRIALGLRASRPAW
jgi:hypothetical protein